MALTFDGTTSIVQTTPKVVGDYGTAFPFTIFAWVKQGASPPAVGFPMYLLAQAADTGANNHTAGIRTNPATAMQVFTSIGSTVAAPATQAVAVGTWKPVMVAFNSASSRTIYFGTGASVTDTAAASVVVNLISQLIIGSGWKGDVACVGLWSSALTLANYQTLAGSAGGGSGGGVVPSTVSNGTLIDYWSLLTQAGTHTGVNGRVLTATNTSQAADHPITESGGGASAPKRTLLLGVG